MTKAEFKHYDLTLVEPAFDSPLTDLIIDLNHLRRKRLDGTTSSQIFFQSQEHFPYAGEYRLSSYRGK